MAKIKTVNGKSVSQQLVSILNRALKQSATTGIMTHCRNIHLDKQSNGKAVNFEYQHRYFRITEALKVSEYEFGFNCRNIFGNNSLTHEIEELISFVK